MKLTRRKGAIGWIYLVNNKNMPIGLVNRGGIEIMNDTKILTFHDIQVIEITIKGFAYWYEKCKNETVII